MTFLKVTEFENGKPILFGQNSSRTPFSVAVKAVDIQPNSQAKKVIAEGSFIAAVGSDIRVLPRTKAKNATATNSAIVALKAPCQTFKVGDVLRAMAGYAEINLSGAAATGDTVTVRVNRINYSITVAGTQTIAAAATLVAALTIPNVTLTQVGSTGKIIAVAQDSFSLAVTSSNAALVTTVTSTEPGFFGNQFLPLGTIQSISAANSSEERDITLSGNAAYVVPANTIIGVDVEKLLGVYPEQLDLTDLPVVHVAPVYHADGVYEKNLPYVDAQIKRVLHGLNINKQFYGNV
jgi:hypothetical protein